MKGRLDAQSLATLSEFLTKLDEGGAVVHTGDISVWDICGDEVHVQVAIHQGSETHFITPAG